MAPYSGTFVVSTHVTHDKYSSAAGVRTVGIIPAVAISPYLADLRAVVGKRLLMMPSASAIIRDESRRILLAEDISTGFWSPPGGAIEPHERPADAVVREVREELGVTVAPLGLIGVFGGPEFVLEYHNGDRVAYVVTLFECEILDGMLEADGEEVARFRFVDPATLDELNVAPWARHALERIRSGGSDSRFDPPVSRRAHG